MACLCPGPNPFASAPDLGGRHLLLQSDTSALWVRTVGSGEEATPDLTLPLLGWNFYPTNRLDQGNGALLFSASAPEIEPPILRAE